MATEAELIGALRKADAAGDVAGAQRIAEIIRGQRNTTQAPEKPAEPSKKRERPKGTEPATAFVQGALRGAFNLPGVATSAIDAVAGTHLNEAYEADRAARAESNPVASGAGYLAGSLAGGGAVMKGLQAIPRVGAALAPVAGQTVRNVGRYAIPAAVGGGVQAVSEGAPPNDAAAIAVLSGASGGMLGAGMAGLSARGVQNLAGRFDEGGQGAARDANAVRYLAGRLNESPEELAAEVARLETAAGRPMSLAEFVNARSAADLRDTAEVLRPVGDAVRAREAAVTAARPASMSAQVRRGGGTDTASAIAQRADDAMDAARQTFRNESAPLTQGQAEAFLDPDAVRYLNRDLRMKLNAIYDAGGGPLSITDLDSLRQAFGAAGKPGQNHALFDLSRRAREIAEANSTAYRQGMADYDNLRNVGEGFETGMAGKDPASFTGRLDRRAAATPEFAGGRATGTRTRFVTEAERGEGAALGLARRLAEPSGVRAATLGALPDSEVARLQALGDAEAQSAERLRQIVPPVTGGDPQTEQLTQTLVEGGMAASGRTLSGYAAHVIRRTLQRAKNLGVTEETARRVGALLADPSRAQDAIRLLKEKRVSDQKIRELMQFVAAGTGTATGE